jgi:hypothetical protein
MKLLVMQVPPPSRHLIPPPNKQAPLVNECGQHFIAGDFSDKKGNHKIPSTFHRQDVSGGSARRKVPRLYLSAGPPGSMLLMTTAAELAESGLITDSP